MWQFFFCSRLIQMSPSRWSSPSSASQRDWEMDVLPLYFFFFLLFFLSDANLPCVLQGPTAKEGLQKAFRDKLKHKKLRCVEQLPSLPTHPPTHTPPPDTPHTKPPTTATVAIRRHEGRNLWRNLVGFRLLYFAYLYRFHLWSWWQTRLRLYL